MNGHIPLFFFFAKGSDTKHSTIKQVNKYTTTSCTYTERYSSEVNVSLLRLCFHVLQFLQYVCEVILQIFLQCHDVFCIYTKETVCLTHRDRENGIT